MATNYGENFFPGSRINKINESTDAGGQEIAGEGGAKNAADKVVPYTKNREIAQAGSDAEFPETLSDPKVGKGRKEELPAHFNTVIIYRGRPAKMFLGMTSELFKIYQTKNPNLDHEIYDELDGRLKRVLLKHITLAK